MRLPVLVFDIETMTDLKSGAHLYGLNLPEGNCLYFGFMDR